MDMTSAIVPKSDQINAEDLLTGPRVFTIVRVYEGSAEQPVNIELAETPGRVYRPSKSMSRVMVHAWGGQADAYAGRKLKLFRNPEITFGRDKVGGIEIAELSHIEAAVTLFLMVRRGQRKAFTVKPLREVARTEEPGAVPSDVIAKTDQYEREGKVQQYLDWLTEKGAPEFILDYVESKLPKVEVDEAALSWGGAPATPAGPAAAPRTVEDANAARQTDPTPAPQGPADKDPEDPAEPPEDEPPMEEPPVEDEPPAPVADERPAPGPVEDQGPAEPARDAKPIPSSERSTLTADSAEPVGAGNVRILSALLTEAGYASTSKKCAVLASKTGRAITALSELTKGEASKFIKELQDMKAAHERAQQPADTNGGQ